MCEELRILGLLLYKNYIVRKRHWFISIIEFILPAVIIGIAISIRSGWDVEPIHVNENSYFPILSKPDLINDHVSKSLLRLYYKPRNNFTDELMKNVTRCAELPHQHLIGFATEDEMLQSFEIQQSDDELISVLAIDFDDTKFDGPSINPKKLIYKMRSSQEIPEKLFDFEGLHVASDKLISEIPIVALQMCLDDAFIDRATSPGVTKPKVVIQKMPYPPYDNINPSEISIQYALHIVGGIIFFATIYLVPIYIIMEKKSGVNTLLKLNGVKSYQNLLSWLVNGMLFSIIPIFVLTTIFKLSFHSQKPFYYHSNCSIIWFALFINISHIYAFCLHAAVYFSKAWLAQMVILTVVAVMNASAAHFEETTYFSYVPYLGILFPGTATMRIIDELNKRENELTGAQWNNVFETVNPALTITGSLGFIMLSSVLGIILHLILAIYFDAVLPSEYGDQKSCLFFLQFGKNWTKQNKVSDNDISEGQAMILEPGVDGGYTPWIVLKNLAKCFTSGCMKSNMVEAVKGITLTIYKGQITALLGQNGAGKTTIFSILTGSMKPTKGTVTINGKDMSEDLDAIRSDLGVCPQENTVFPYLTVEEQLRLVALLKQKNQTRKQVMYDVDEMLNKLNMCEKRNVMPHKLSGGQKRRLCLGMALIGDASTLFLDEPTSGMDPETRRGTWDVLLQYRNKKTIVMTTHSMEEADVLGDRIAIMQSGKMKCYGTPMYLKKHYGHNSYEVTLSTTTWCDKEKIEDLVGSEAKVNPIHDGRMIIYIPITTSLPEILDNMEKRKAELGITGVSASSITLEQVFLRAAKDVERKVTEDCVDGPRAPVEEGYECLQGSELMRQRIKALLKKKLTYFKSDKYLFVAMICGALVAILFPVVTFPNSSKETSTLPFDLTVYQSPEVLIYSKSQTLGDAYKKIIESQGGTGTLTKVRDSLNNEIALRASTDLTQYKTRMIISAELNSTSLVNGLYSGGATLSAPITVNAVSNLVLKTLAGDQYSIVASIGELPRPLKRGPKEKELIIISMLSRAFIFMTIFFHVVALFVKHPLLEDSTKVKQLQQMAGASAFLYWGTTFIVDYTFYILLTVLTVFGMVQLNFLNVTSPIGQTEIGILLLLFLLFGINSLLFAYIHSFIKNSFHIVYGYVSALPLCLAMVLLLVQMVSPRTEDAKTASIIQRRIFTLEPHVSFVFGYMKYAEIATENARCRGLSNRLSKAACAVDDTCCDMKCADGHCENPLPYFGCFSEDGGLAELVMYLMLAPIILVGILYLLEHPHIFVKPDLEPKSKDRAKPSDTEAKTEESIAYQTKSKFLDKPLDTEVAKEESIVYQAINKQNSASGEKKPDSNNNNVFMAHKLSKRYGKLKVVKEVTFRVKKNECFGLLGVNGAGKSTTFRMLVGEETPSSGRLHRDSYSMQTNRTQYLAGIGYCPQNDALIPYFNALDHLSLFANLRGVPHSKVQSEIDSWINKLQMKDHEGISSRFYSGGYKRRLNIAMALIANPKLILLDEPTTGVDPAARRLVWTIVQSCQAAGQSIILTSHSMDECEALCDRLVIMAEGQLLCVGASEELKERFGAGYNITIKLDPRKSEQDLIQIKKKIQNSLTCELKDEHPGYLLYHVTDAKATWAKMFGIMNELKADHGCIEDFTVSTSTLEQLFMQIARSSREPPMAFYVKNNKPLCV